MWCTKEAKTCLFRTNLYQRQLARELETNPGRGELLQSTSFSSSGSTISSSNEQLPTIPSSTNATNDDEIQLIQPKHELWISSSTTTSNATPNELQPKLQPDELPATPSVLKIAHIYPKAN
jgi:hypothetical protein